MRTTNSWPVLFCWGMAVVLFVVSVNFRDNYFFVATFGYEHRFNTDNAYGATANATEYMARHLGDVNTANACLICSAIFLLMGCVERLRVAVFQARDPFATAAGSPPPPPPEAPLHPTNWERTVAASGGNEQPPTLRELGRGLAEMWRQFKAEVKKLWALLTRKE